MTTENEPIKVEHGEEIGVAVVLMRGGRILVSRRTSAVSSYPHCFQLPGGSVEPQESSYEAARREVREEVGLDAQISPERVARTHSVKMRGDVRVPYATDFFVGVLPDAPLPENPEPHKHSGWSYLQAIDFLSLPDEEVLPDTKGVVATLAGVTL